MPRDQWMVEQLACPLDHGDLQVADGALHCADGHRFPVIDGVPVMLSADLAPTMIGTEQSLRRAEGGQGDGRAPELYLESLGISEEEKRGVVELASRGGRIDPVVAYLIAATNGLMYRHLIGSLDRYPIPPMPLPPGGGSRLLDVGCSWGRWSLSAHARGYDVIGLDASLGAVMAARRVAAQLRVPNRYVVGDARRLPFRAGTFEAAYSYSVLQHFAKADATSIIREMGRVVGPGGRVKVQMAARYGLRCLYHQWRRGFTEGSGFEVRYWSPRELRDTFSEAVGPTAITIDGFLGIGLQPADEPLMPATLKAALRFSESLKKVSEWVRPLMHVADSLYVESVKPVGNPGRAA
ncbi:MAG TPA: methyltransferase domain-containing protein [Vicinamibacterales bacterium]|nr:methyltransferase domain-containing protein [Vicinamibacterales bacterium]